MTTEVKYEIIGREGCTFCTRAQILLFDNDLAFEYKTLDEDVSRETIEERIGGPFRTVPQIFKVHGNGQREYVGGYTELAASI